MYNYEIISDNLTTKYIGQTFIQFDELVSIHTKSKNISDNCPTGMLVLTELQEDVKLKNNKIWINSDDNILMSIILKNKKDYTSEILQIVNVSVCEALLALDDNVNCHIKWPNDIYIDDKKICSIFSEKISKKDNESLIVSIYINISNDKESINDEIKDKMISLKDIYNKEMQKEILISNILNKIEIYYEELLKTKAIKSTINVFKKHNCIIGKNIGIRKINKKTVRKVQAIDINNNGDIEVLDKNNAKDFLKYGQDTIEWWSDEQQVKNK